MMRFCPSCESRLMLVREGSELLLTCPKCSYKEKAKGEAKVVATPEEPQVVVIGKEHDLHTFPSTKSSCPRCGHDRAFFWMVQTRGADESSTQFFRCTKCGHTWRELG
jgi:DNA-directed RNA polymerase subunit M